MFLMCERGLPRMAFFGLEHWTSEQPPYFHFEVQKPVPQIQKVQKQALGKGLLFVRFIGFQTWYFHVFSCARAAAHSSRLHTQPWWWVILQLLHCYLSVRFGRSWIECINSASQILLWCCELGWNATWLFFANLSHCNHFWQVLLRTFALQVQVPQVRANRQGLVVCSDYSADHCRQGRQWPEGWAELILPVWSDMMLPVKSRTRHADFHLHPFVFAWFYGFEGKRWMCLSSSMWRLTTCNMWRST